MKTALILLFSLSLAACSGPFITLPGGELQGTLTEVPPSWGEGSETVQLETRPDDPYSINIWAVSTLGNLYVSSTREPRWLAHIEADPRVRMKIDGKLYELLATRTTDIEEMEAVSAAYAAKYQQDESPTMVNLFRLTPR